ncbi:MAG: D-alanyl-D-alanine carboxypeptidase/D-alanyl-D-alanine-endopeptidase [Propionibacteriaceae bacterium]|nr:D-alanyl-D-alanine carboxypeptidase/D-alanyl-D-alanine-endopeptidase [Propionibacteriaceae bacterium]
MSWLSSTQQWIVPAASNTVPQGLFVSPSPIETPSTPPPIPDPSSECLSLALGSVPYSGGSGTLTGEVLGMASNQMIWSRDGDVPQLPASSEKLLTTLALVDTLGPNALATTYTTQVVSTSNNHIILVGGGDPYLASTKDLATINQPATLADLATQTASTLTGQGITSVTLGFDDTAFTGPSWAPSWTGDDAGEVTRVSALWVDEGRTPAPGTTTLTPGSDTAALDATRLFATQLAANGVTVTAVDDTGAQAPADATTVASIQSLSLGAIIAHTLLISDNSSAEVLLRHLAIAAKQPASFDGGATAVMQWVESKRFEAPGFNVVDGSGLSRRNSVSASTFVRVVQWAGSSDGPAREVIARLPVASVSGTLLGRFSSPDAAAARGTVHAKTGSLTGVATLTGYTVTTSGQVLAFSFMVNSSNMSTTNIRAWIDQMAATLTGVNC